MIYLETQRRWECHLETNFCVTPLWSATELFYSCHMPCMSHNYRGWPNLLNLPPSECRRKSRRLWFDLGHIFSVCPWGDMSGRNALNSLLRNSFRIRLRSLLLVPYILEIQRSLIMSWSHISWKYREAWLCRTQSLYVNSSNNLGVRVIPFPYAIICILFRTLTLSIDYSLWSLLNSFSNIYFAVR